jgi:hypothetical protein
VERRRTQEGGRDERGNGDVAEAHAQPVGVRRSSGRRVRRR